MFSKNVLITTLLISLTFIYGYTLSAKECPDLVVDGDKEEEVNIDGGCYGIILIKHNGNLTANGDVAAQEVFIKWGQATFNGNLDVTDYIEVQAVPTGTMTVKGDVITNSISVKDGTSLEVSGNVSIQQMSVNGTMTVKTDVTANSVSIEGGILEVSGNVFTQQMSVNGTMDVGGNMSAQQITVQSGKLTVNTIDSSQEQPLESVTVESGELHLCGNWFVNDMRINGGSVKVIPFSDSLEGSGTFVLECNQFMIGEDASLNANAAGGDTRGQGVDGGNTGGGGYGGKGGDGDDHAGGTTYGDHFSPTIDMGSRGGNECGNCGGKGGGSISIISTSNVAIYGTITANGGNAGRDSGGGSGGGVLIRSPNLELTGSITANGGNGGWAGGGGGGGRIKLFYGTGVAVDAVSDKLSVSGGASGYFGENGTSGTIWTDAIPNPPELVAPANEASLASHRPIFKFNVTDTSVDTDNRDDDLSCVIELSVDNFAGIYKTYDQNVALSGWSKLSYKSGDEVEFTPTEDLPEGVYQWRSTVRDRSLKGDYSAVRSFRLGTPPTIELNASPSSLLADGESTSLITATLTSPEGEPVKDAEIVMELKGDGTLSEVTNNKDGTHTATYTASKTPGDVTISAHDTSSNVGASVKITLTSLPATPDTGTYKLDLHKGLNNIALPVKPPTTYTASSLADRLNASIILKYDSLEQEFVPYIPEHLTASDFPIKGGEGYIVNLLEDKQISFTGTVWDNVNAASKRADPKRSLRSARPPRSVVSYNVWAFVIAGNLPLELRNQTRLTISVSNQNRIFRSVIMKSGDFTSQNQFQLAFVNRDRSAVVEAGEQIGITVTDADGQLVAQQQFTVKPKDLANAFIIVNPRYNPTPDQTALLQNYPNPFNPETWIPFQLAESADVTISIYDISGRLIRTLFLGELHAGIYITKGRAAYWNGRNDIGERVSSGVYFYKMDAGGFTAAKKLVIFK